jgi:hypothetical protein
MLLKGIIETGGLDIAVRTIMGEEIYRKIIICLRARGSDHRQMNMGGTDKRRENSVQDFIDSGE